MSEPVILDDWMLGTIQTLDSERDTARKQSQEWMHISALAQVKKSENLKLYAEAKGISLDDYQFDDKLKAFIPKSKSADAE